MERKEFIKKSAIAVLGLQCLPMIDIFGRTQVQRFSPADASSNIVRVPEYLQQKFNELIEWMTENGWIKYLEDIIGISLPENREQWLQPLSSDILERVKKKKGFEDFGGKSILHAGYPQFSLLYHMLASPRVSPEHIKKYPGIKELDLVEDYIFAMSGLPQDVINQPGKYALAVLAYEYRPAAKVPPYNIAKEFRKHADFVFSRTGISRVGDQPYNYVGEMRSFSNKPLADEYKKNIAVSPARYGLFLVETVQLDSFKHPSVSLLNYEEKDKERYFVRPIRKMMKGEELQFTFGEYHRNEKLFQLADFKIKKEKQEDNIILSENFYLHRLPFIRESAQDEQGKKLLANSSDTSSDMVSLELIGSSVLLSSIPAPFIRPAIQDGRRISFWVPKKWEKIYSNRRYTSFKFISPDSHDAIDVALTDGLYRSRRRTSRFGTPRNGPMFANIRYQQEGKKEIHLDENFENFEEKINDGEYYAGLFEDSICDGCISVKIERSPETLKGLKVFPAFSLVTAPDFFPLVDSNDLNYFYNKMGYAADEHFLEGGTINLSGLRLRSNSNLKDPFSQHRAFPDHYPTDDTILAVLSLNANRENGTERFNINYDRDYCATTFLPDSASGIFYPGWDATFSSRTKDERFFATFGLGSPFPEDMKLCAAANGMWPVTSPDAGRTFQGGLDKIPVYNRKPSTSVPLMDDEIGYHPNSPYVKDFDLKPCFGWDGEHGPFLQKLQKVNGKRFVNFTDIGRADYVANCLDPDIGFDMHKLRTLVSRELLDRMDSLRYCLRTIDKRFLGSKKVQYTKYWLVNAQQILNWEKFIPHCISVTFIGKDNKWINGGRKLNGKGYLFVFVLTKNKGIDMLECNKSKRRIQEIKEVCVCKVEKGDEEKRFNLVWCRLKGNFDTINADEIIWENA